MIQTINISREQYDIWMATPNWRKSTVYPHYYCRSSQTAPQGCLSPQTLIMEIVRPHTYLKESLKKSIESLTVVKLGEGGGEGQRVAGNSP